MNWIEIMIAEQCPKGVERVKLGEVIRNLRTGLNPRVHFKLNTIDAQDYYITVRELKGFDIKVDEKTDRINETARIRINERSKLQINDILFSGTGTIGRTAIVKEAPTNWNIKEGVYAITSDTNLIIPYYFIYVLHSSEIVDQISNKAGGSTVKSIPMAEFKKLEIPLPPLSIQEEIVSVLDKFTELIEKTDEEIALRQKQYEYYREKLLTFKEGEVEWKKLGDVSNILTGGELKKDIFVSAEKNGEYIYPVYGNGKDVYGYINTYRVKNDSVCISSIGANTGAIFYHKGMFTPIIRLKVIELLDDSIVAKYIYYFLSTLKISSKNGGGIPNINANDVKMLQIPLPPPSRQQEIVDTLDKFEALISKLKEERELRQKQYEYYREKLLTF